jgi:hypothetical protein
MNQEEVFSVWAPKDSIWSAWVAPVLFAQTHWAIQNFDLIAPQPLPWLQKQMRDAALVVDLPFAESVEVGFALAADGFRPVPLYNASPGPPVVGLAPGSQGVSNAAIDMRPIVAAICRVTPSLQRLKFLADAPPAFLLDFHRLVGTTRPVEQGMFDNRWMVFPQDFPSASFLLSHGIRRALLVQKQELEPQDDLAHSLLRWQEGGIKVLSKRLDDNSMPSEITVKRPSKYKATWYRALAQLGLRRSTAGGFGSYIPETTAAG